MPIKKAELPPRPFVQDTLEADAALAVKQLSQSIRAPSFSLSIRAHQLVWGGTGAVKGLVTCYLSLANSLRHIMRWGYRHAYPSRRPQAPPGPLSRTLSRQMPHSRSNNCLTSVRPLTNAFSLYSG